MTPAVEGESRSVQTRLMSLFAEKLGVEVPSVNSNLFEIGVLDSQKVGELLLHIEEQFDVQIGTEDFESENIYCIKKIADVIVLRRGGPGHSAAGLE